MRETPWSHCSCVTVSFGHGFGSQMCGIVIRVFPCYRESECTSRVFSCVRHHHSRVPRVTAPDTLNVVGGRSPCPLHVRHSIATRGISHTCNAIICGRQRKRKAWQEISPEEHGEHLKELQLVTGRLRTYRATLPPPAPRAPPRACSKAVGGTDTIPVKRHRGEPGHTYGTHGRIQAHPTPNGQDTLLFAISMSPMRSARDSTHETTREDAQTHKR